MPEIFEREDIVRPAFQAQAGPFLHQFRIWNAGMVFRGLFRNASGNAFRRFAQRFFVGFRGKGENASVQAFRDRDPSPREVAR